MKELELSDQLAERVEDLYVRMEAEYDRVAGELQFGCQGCPDNCCDSHFQHHTYIEWAYLWKGLRELSADKIEQVEKWAAEHVRECSRAEGKGERPQVMCPLNEEGLCILYKHRMLVCRTHGVPATMQRPDGQVLRFPGCFRCQELVEKQGIGEDDVASVERTPLLRELVMMEDEFLQRRRHLYPKVKLTIAEMIIKGPPMVPPSFCERGCDSNECG
jgi:hypothetical protein